MNKKRSPSQKKTSLALSHLRVLMVLNFIALTAVTWSSVTTFAMLDRQSNLPQITQSYGFDLRLDGS